MGERRRVEILREWVKLDANGVVLECAVGGAQAVLVDATLVNGAWGSRTLLVRWRAAGGVAQDFASARTLNAAGPSTQLVATDLEGRGTLVIEMGGSAASAGALVEVVVVGEREQ